MRETSCSLSSQISKENLQSGKLLFFCRWEKSESFIFEVDFHISDRNENPELVPDKGRILVFPLFPTPFPPFDLKGSGGEPR